MSKRIKGITIEIDGETKGLDKALSDVTKRSRDVSKELRDVDRLLKFNPGNTELIAQKQKLLGDQVKVTRERLDRLKDSQDGVTEAFKRGEISEEQYRAFQREIAETESKLQHYEGQLEKTQSKLERFGEKTAEVGEKFKSAGDKMTSAGKSLSTKVTAPIAGVGAIAAKVGSDFEASMSKVAAVSGATGDDLTALTDKAREMGATTQFSASEAADALNYMALAGWDTQQMLDGISGVMDLAAASGEDLGRVSDILTDGLSAFGMEAGESARFADVLAAASANANTDVSGLGAAFQYVAPVAGALGFTIEDTATAIGLMSNAGIKGEKAGTALRTMMTNLAKPTKAMQDEMNKLGISLTDSEGNMKDFDTIMRELRVSFDDLTEAEQASAAATIFGKEAMSGALAVINAAESDFEALGEAINNSEGAANDMATTMQDNLQGRMKEMQSALEEAAISIYDNLKPALEFVVQLVKSVADWFNNLSPAVQNTMVVIAGLVAAIGPLLVVLGVLASSIGSILTIAPKVATAFAAISGPVGIAIGVITALIAVGVLLYKNWDTIKEYAVKVWGAISDFLSKSWNSIKKNAEKIWNSIADFFRKLWDRITDIFNSVLDAIQKTIQRYWDSIKGGVEKVWNGIASYFEGIWEVIKNIFVGAFLILLQLITGQWDDAKRTTEQVWNNIKNGLSKVWDGIKSVFSGALSAILGFVRTYFNDVKSTITTIWNDIKSFISNVINNVGTTISNGFNRMKQAVSNTMKSVQSTIRSIWNNVLKFLKGINLRNIGRNIIQGLIDGVKSMANSVINSVKGVVDGAINGAKKLLGIKSPSRVFMEIGKFSGEGLAKGLSSMANSVRRSSEQLAKTTIPTLPKYDLGYIHNNALTPSSRQDARNVSGTTRIENVIMVDGYELGRILTDHIDLFQGEKASVRSYVRGG